MANPTTNYSWPMPTSTDLVTDLPADFALFGQPVDTSLKALNPETTLGDIAYRSSTSNTNTRLGIGSTSQVLTVVSGVPAWAASAGGGKVLQVVSATYSTQTATGSNTYIDSGLTLAITPTLNTSKVLVLVMQSAVAYATSAVTAISIYVKLMRASTTLTATTNGQLFAGGASSSALEIDGVISFSFLDSPATTSSTTYKTQFLAGNGGNTQVQPNGALSSIILLEIGA